MTGMTLPEGAHFQEGEVDRLTEELRGLREIQSTSNTERME